MSTADKRRAEIEAKRAKLAELRKVRADRQRAETDRRFSQPDVSPVCTHMHCKTDFLCLERAPRRLQKRTSTIFSEKSLAIPDRGAHPHHQAIWTAEASSPRHRVYLEPRLWKRLLFCCQEMYLEGPADKATPSPLAHYKGILAPNASSIGA